MPEETQDKGNWLWPSNETIENDAKEYDSKTWSAPRNILIYIFTILVLLNTLFSFLLGKKDTTELFLGYLLFFLPLGYFLNKGYRFSFIAAIALETFALVSGIVRLGFGGSAIAIIVWLLITDLALRSFRIESARKRLGLAKKRRVWLDILIGVGLFVVMLFFAYVHLSAVRAGAGYDEYSQPAIYQEQEYSQ